MSKIEVGVLGATGMVGQQFVNQLRDHPWFDLTWLGASERSEGKTYEEATNWVQDNAMPDEIASKRVSACAPGDTPKLVFSAMEASVAGPIEQAFANAGCAVVSNTRNHRMDEDVPLLVPEINADHLGVIETQKKNRGWDGFIVTNPNCSTIAMTMSLAPLSPFGINKVLVTTLQAISGAGYPGLAAVDIVANIIPFIKGEEEKMQSETHKIMGPIVDGRMEPHPAVVSAHCNRVQVIDGHTVAVSVELDQKPSLDEVAAAMREFRGVPQHKDLPTAPKQPVHLRSEPNRPQTRRDAMAEGGMAVTVGRLRECPILGHKYVALGHNTIRGAAGAAVLNAELLKVEGLLD